jgi:predicted nucleotidyltransferase
MRIERDATVAGLPVLRVRDALQACRGPDGFYGERLAARLGLAPPDAAAVLDELVTLGYVEPYEDGWRTTTAGNALAMAKATRPVSRAKAEAALATFLRRVAEVNTSDRFLCRVEEVVLFGSFLNPDFDPVGDVDVAVSIRLKPTDANVATLSLAHARASGRRFTSFTDEMFWPEMEVRLYLKSASRVVSMTTTDDAILETAAHKTIYCRADDAAVRRAPRGSQEQATP